MISSQSISIHRHTFLLRRLTVLLWWSVIMAWFFLSKPKYVILLGPVTYTYICAALRPQLTIVLPSQQQVFEQACVYCILLFRGGSLVHGRITCQGSLVDFRHWTTGKLGFNLFFLFFFQWQIEKFFPHVLEKEKSRAKGEPSILSPEEFAFAKE